MTGRGIEKLGLAFVDTLRNVADNMEVALERTFHPDSNARVAMAGEFHPQTLSPRTKEEEGGTGRFPAALAMGIAAVHGDPEKYPVEEIFKEIHANQQKEGHVKHSERTSSTPAMVSQLEAADLDCMEGIQIARCSDDTVFEQRLDRQGDVRLPLYDRHNPRERAALVMPLTWQLILREVELPDEFASYNISPLWTAVTGGKRVEGGSGDYQVEAGPSSTFFRVAFPVRKPDEAPGSGFVTTIPGLTFEDLFTSPEVEMAGGAPNHPNIAYKISAA